MRSGRVVSPGVWIKHYDYFPTGLACSRFVLQSNAISGVYFEMRVGRLLNILDAMGAGKKTECIGKIREYLRSLECQEFPDASLGSSPPVIESPPSPVKFQSRIE